ncbi:MAG: efflux RND transporter periplasmic adaptor subunit [Syntrophales bacterium]
MKKIIIASVIIIVIAVGIFMIVRKNDDGTQYTTQKVTRGNIQATVTATGTLNAVTTVLVGTQVSGTIKNLYADYNSYVKKGQLLAQIDPANFEAQVQQAKANLAVAAANVEKAKAAVLDTNRALARNKLLAGRNLIAISDLDTAETNELAAVAQQKAAEAQVEQAQAALKIAMTNLQYTRIVSPVDGMVISRNVDVGQTVAASFQTPTLFNIAQDLAKMQIDVSVDEADIGRIKGGESVEFRVDAYPDKTLKGRVAAIRNAPITVQNVVTYDVVVLVQNQEKILKPGMTANVSIITSVHENVLQVPNSAFRFRPGIKYPTGVEAPERKGPVIWVLDNGKPHKIVVGTGISDGDNTEVISPALKEEDDVIVAAIDKKKQQGSLFGRRVH